MKVLQLGKFYPILGGVEKVMYDLALGLGRIGVDCDMLCAESDGPGFVREVGPHVRLISCRTWRKVAATTISPTMVSLLRKIAPMYDIIHIHHPDPMAALALRMSGYKGKVVLHWHSDILKQKQLLRLYAPLQSWLIKRADVIVGTTPDYIRGSVWLDKEQEKCRVVPIGIVPLQRDPEGADKIRARFPGKNIVLFLGRLIGYKGLEYLIKAASYLPSDYVVVLGGEGELHGQLQHQIDSLGLTDRVVLLGMVPQEEMEGWYTAASVFCLPSVMKTEAFGIVQIEAMSVGTPVVATRIPGSGTAWVNEHGVSGLNTEIRDPQALAEAIMGVTRNDTVRAAFGAGAKERFDRMFHIDRMIQTVLEIYNSIFARCEN